MNTETGNSSEDSGEVDTGPLAVAPVASDRLRRKEIVALTIPPNPAPADPNDDLLVGADEIGRFLGGNARRGYYLLQTGQIPCFKIGRMWHARRSTLLKFMGDQERARGGASTQSR